MACFRHDSATSLEGSQPVFTHCGLETTTVKAKEDPRKIRPHGLRDCVHVDPEHVWGDEGPVNE